MADLKNLRDGHPQMSTNYFLRKLLLIRLGCQIYRVEARLLPCLAFLTILWPDLPNAKFEEQSKTLSRFSQKHSRYLGNMEEVQQQVFEQQRFLIWDSLHPYKCHHLA